MMSIFTEQLGTTKVKKKTDVRRMAVIGLMAAISSVLMMLNFPSGIPNLKVDFSEVPALLTAFIYGPGAGVMVSLIKALVNLPFSTSGGVGELSNFLLSATLVLVASVIYSRFRTKKGVLIALPVASLAMALVSIATNYYIVFPVFSLVWPMETILGMYKTILPFDDIQLIHPIVLLNAPFTLAKGLVSSAIVLVVYKKLAPILRGKQA